MIAVACALGLPAPAAVAQSVSAGRQVFEQCSVCHSATTANGTGPGLQGIVGRKAGAFPGFRYSRAMKNSGVTWDEASLDTFIANPQAAVPGTVMPFSGIPDAAQRADLVAYLKEAK